MNRQTDGAGQGAGGEGFGQSWDGGSVQVTLGHRGISSVCVAIRKEVWCQDAS